MTVVTLAERRVLKPDKQIKEVFNLQDIFEDRLNKLVNDLRKDHGEDSAVVIKGPLTTIVKLENGTRMVDVAMLVDLDADRIDAEGTLR